MLGWKHFITNKTFRTVTQATAQFVHVSIGDTNIAFGMTIVALQYEILFALPS